MAVTQTEVLQMLKSGQEISVPDLLKEIRQTSPERSGSVKATILALISGDKVEFTPARKLRLK